MKHTCLMCILLFGTMIFITGCWNRIELNDISIVVGSGVDIINKDTFALSDQIIVASRIHTAQGGGSTGAGGDQAFITVTATGKSLLDAGHNMQSKLSRQLFFSHRQNIFIGETLAKYGLEKISDEYSRNPNTRLRSDIWVVKNNTALNLLKVSYPLESIPALAILKTNKHLGGPAGMSLIDFLKTASSETSSPTLPVVEIVEEAASGRNSSDSKDQKNTTRTIKFAGRAVFDKQLKLVGYLSFTEALDRFWMSGRKRFYTLTGYIPEGEGTVTLDARKLKSKINTSISPDQKVNISVLLTAAGKLNENNTNLDLRASKNIKLVETALNKELEKRIAKMITKMQKLGVDVFRFDDHMHRQHPDVWKSLKNDWQKKFKEADISVKVEVSIRNTGLTGPALQLRKQEIVK
ncbi:Ger(x)C family spore germination protein [Paenibacillus filicis]|uniref:Ger(X)C family spore germination protein n=1 Tax=Paenibacillus gyeongsangnamensis TaxID=3388067 RepID=A0ABT4Q5N7_9BACL|nr:Ger(x)C family spore germination protein [Paenibacillus filicis]MCZ8512177.1 Ger(x)C family spore germination protein [Paenibacillus filicis]